MTFGFPSWGSLSPLKGHLTIPKKSQRIAWWTALYLPFSQKLFFFQIVTVFHLAEEIPNQKKHGKHLAAHPLYLSKWITQYVASRVFFSRWEGPAPTHKSDHTGSFRTSSFFVGENGQCGCNTWWKHLATKSWLLPKPFRGEISWLPKLSMNCKIQTCLPFYCTWNPLSLKTLHHWLSSW